MTEQELDNAISDIVIAQVALNTSIIDIILKDVINISKLDKSSVFQYFYKEDEIKTLINARIRHIQTLTTNVLYNIALDVYKDARALYEHRNIQYLEFLKNVEISQVLFDENKHILDVENTINKNGIIMLNHNSPTRLGVARRQIVQEAQQTIVLGNNFNRSMRKTLDKVADSGIRIFLSDKATQQTDIALERALFYSARDVETNTSKKIGEQVNTDGVELSAHIMPAPDHAPAQGHQFTNNEFENMQKGRIFNDVQGRAYASFERQIGTWNCRHTVRNIIIGVTKQKFTDAQLQSILNSNQTGKIIAGKHRTLYECTQIQRRYERQIRDAKTHMHVFSSVKDMQMADKYYAKVRQLTSEYMEFSRKCGISPNVERLRIQ